MRIPAFRALGAGPTIVMLHGISGGSAAFAPQIEHFSSQGFRAVSWDMPGYGSSAPIEPYTFKGLAESLATLIDALDPSGDRAPVILLGHSMGGMVAQELIARRPGLVRALILANTVPAFGHADGAAQQRYITERSAPIDAGLSMQRRAVDAAVCTAADPHTRRAAGLGRGRAAGHTGHGRRVGVRLATQVMGGVPSAVYRAALDAITNFDRHRMLSHIRVPTLFIAGTEDKAAPPALMQAMARQVPGSEYVELGGVGHLSPLEAPDLFGDTVLSFLARRKSLHSVDVMAPDPQPEATGASRSSDQAGKPPTIH